MHRQSPQHWEELRGVSHLLAKLPRSGVGAFHVWGGQPLDGNQRGAERDLQVKFTLQTWRRIR